MSKQHKMQKRTDEDIKQGIVYHLCALIALTEMGTKQPLKAGSYLGTFDFDMTREGENDFCEIHVGQLDLIRKDQMQ